MQHSSVSYDQVAIPAVLTVINYPMSLYKDRRTPLGVELREQGQLSRSDRRDLSKTCAIDQNILATWTHTPEPDKISKRTSR